MSGRVAIIDSGGANIASLTFAFERLGIEATLTRDADTIRAADRVLLPGVGNEINGATRWVSIAGITVQVSEPARLALILGRHRQREPHIVALVRPPDQLAVKLAIGVRLINPHHPARLDGQFQRPDILFRQLS